MTTDHATRIVMSHRLLRRYVLPGERVVLATRRHWAKLLEPVGTAIVVFAVCGGLTALLQPALGEGVLVVWWLWLVALARLGWFVLVWRVEWFVATDKRMLLLTGLITHQIGMMPLMKVTDMRYSRSVLGQVLGYGQFLLESAGQDQALRQINWVARPDATYRDLCALIFTPVSPPASDGEDDDGAQRAPRRAPVAAPPERRARLAVADAAPPRVRPAPAAPPPATGWWDEPVVVWPSRERPSEPDDTQPLRVRGADETHDLDVAPDERGDERRLPPTLAQAQEDGTSVEAEAIAGEEALRREEEDALERAWDVSEPTARFVDLSLPLEERDAGVPERDDDDPDGRART